MIADKLNISANTVDTYVRRCFDKLDVRDRVTAGLRGLALGLVA
jgi:LuxR family transcriptional regulator/LuxR family quorum-sensing system transcriptional regulator CciR